MDLILYAAVVPLFAIIVACQVYASPNTPFVCIIHNGSFFGVISPDNAMPIISYFMNSKFSLPSWAISIKLPSASDLFGSCLSIPTRESLDMLVSTAQWATDKLFTCEISHMITIAITSFFTKFFHVTYLRFFISTSSLWVVYTAHKTKPKELNSVCAARQQFKYRIFVFCSVIITSIDHTASVLVTIRSVRCMVVDGYWGIEDIHCHGTWCVVTGITMGVLAVLTKFFAVPGFISVGIENVLKSWKFVETAREKEAARFGLQADDAMERVVNPMKQSERLTEDNREGGEDELFPAKEAMPEIIRLYTAREEALQEKIRLHAVREKGLEEIIRLLAVREKALEEIIRLHGAEEVRANNTIQ